MSTPLAQLTVNNPAPINRSRDLLLGGVPLPQGACRDAAALRLLESDGVAVALQADVQARWPDGTVKWALLCAPGVTVPADGRVRMTLEQTPNTSPTDPAALRVRQTTGGVHVDTGAVRFTVQATGPLVAELEARTEDGWEARIGNLDLCAAVERDGAVRRYSARRADRDVDVEVAGPLRALIRVRGTHGALRGKRTFGPYCLRLEVYAERPEVRLTHSVVYDGDPDRDFVRASEIVLTAEVGRGEHAIRFGSDLGAEEAFPRQRAPRWTPDFRHAELYQDSCSHWRLGRKVDRNKSEVFTAEGLRADGWMELSGDRGAVAVAVRDFWQNHPKSLAVDAGRRELRIGLYPLRAEKLDLQRYSDLAFPHTYENPAFQTRGTVPVDPHFGAHGVRKTHDLLLMLDQDNPSAATLAFNRPLMLQWPPGHTAGARAIAPAASRLDPTWAGTVNEYLDFLAGEMRRSGGTGYLDYFDLPHGFEVEAQRWFHDFGGWGYINDEAMPCLGLWQAYLLTGREDVFHMARAMTRHNADIDSRHLGPWSGYGSRHNINHWGDTCMDRRVSQPIGKRFLYYLTGDRTVLDLAELVLESFRRQPPGLRALNMTCDVPSLVATLMLLTESGLTEGEAWLRDLADAIAQSIDGNGILADRLLVDGPGRTAKCIDAPGPVGFIMFSCFGGTQAFAELAEHYDHDPLRQGLVRLARYQMLPASERETFEPAGQAPRSEALTAFRALDLLGYAYQVTGDEAFVQHARRHADAPCVRIEDRPSPRYGAPDGGTRRLPVTVVWPDASQEDAERWRRFYPLFPRTSSGQFFNIAVYLHKLQGLMLLFGDQNQSPAAP